MNKKIGIAIVGYGNAGKQHYEAIKEIDSLELRAIYDVNSQSCTLDELYVDSIDNLLHRGDIDFISLCIPPKDKFELILKILKSGKSLIIEKPPALSLEQIEILNDYADANQLFISVMFQHRKIIRPFICKNNWNAPYVSGTLEVSRYRSSDYFINSTWRSDQVSAYGGITAHLGIHYLDLACQLLGEPRKGYLSKMRTFSKGIDVGCSGIIEFCKGSTLLFSITGESVIRRERLSILGKDSSICIENGKINYQDIHCSTEILPFKNKELRQAVFQDVISSFNNNSELYYSLKSAINVTKTLNLIYQIGNQW